jgi:hypothetical protein
LTICRYQKGWFSLQRRRVNNNQAQHEAREGENNQEQPGVSDQRQDQTVNQNNNESFGAIRFVFAFIINFFTSLIPERAVRVAN